MSEMKVTGIEPVKTNFYLFTINAYGKQAGKIKLSRSNLLNWLVQRPGMTV
ncbi:transposase [Enterobacteriaceae bacterium H11S18]|uniref:transposase n=1 Tax=Dryocola clanedunensis TaxID=2925396 RepID=UPI0022F0C8B3|nr:transposase [Dryocola clanedunensis]MCT4709128.1 transposase [Dryocola clanedunensis]